MNELETIDAGALAHVSGGNMVTDALCDWGAQIDHGVRAAIYKKMTAQENARQTAVGAARCKAGFDER